jgi:hypothetical protein
MPSLTIPVRTSFVLAWTLADTSGSPINNATVTATLYAGRSTRDPDNIPGTPVSPINNLPLPYIAASAGQYSATVPGTLDPQLDGTGYVLVIDGLVGSTPIYHKEQAVVIETAGSTVDLTTVDAVKNRAEIASDSDDVEIQSAVTGFSQWLLNWSGQASLNSIATLDEIYNGNGNNRLMLRSGPIRSLIAVTQSGLAIPLSTGPLSLGAYVGQSKRYIGIRNGGGGVLSYRFGSSSRGPVFQRGEGNIEVQYTAGYPDVPSDLEYGVRCIVALNYKRKGWQDQRSRTTSAKESMATTSYQSWDFPREYWNIFLMYKREAIIE